MVAERKDPCSWCKYNKFAGSCDADGVCSFKMIAFNRDEIMKVLKLEVEKLQVFSEQKLSDPERMKEAFDVLYGCTTMVTVLREEFGVEEVPLQIMQRMSVKMKLAKLYMKRRTKFANQRRKP